MNLSYLFLVDLIISPAIGYFLFTLTRSPCPVAFVSVLFDPSSLTIDIMLVYCWSTVNSLTQAWNTVWVGVHCYHLLKLSSTFVWLSLRCHATHYYYCFHLHLSNRLVVHAMPWPTQYFSNIKTDIEATVMFLKNFKKTQNSGN